MRQETARLEPPAANPAARVAGWVPAFDSPLRWSRGTSSELTAFVAAPRPLTLVARAEPALPAPRPQRVTVFVNDQRAGELTLGREAAEYRLPLAKDLLHAGDNVLRFEYAWTADPPSADEGHRHQAVIWHGIRLSPAPARPAPVRRAGDALEVPAGTRVDWYVPGSGRAVLELPAVRGPAGATLRVTAQASGGEEQELAVVAPGGRRRWLELPAGRDPVVRLSFAASAPAEGAEDPLRVEAPRVLRREAAPAPEPAPALATGVLPAARRTPSPPPPILVYLVDTLRADHVGAYGCPRPLTPEVDRFAAEASLFRRAVAQAPWTRPAVATLFTGLGPLRHGVTRLEHRLPEEAVTLAELLRRRGYRTGAISSNAHVTRATGMAQGFDRLDFVPRQPSAEHVQRLGLEWLDGLAGDAPYLLYLHVLEPHAPYTPPPDLRARFAPDAPRLAGTRAWLERLYRARGEARQELAAPLGGLYDGEVAAMDRAFGKLRAELERRGEWDRLLVVFVSDHGEGLGERGVVGHAHDLSQEALAIPLIVKRPGQRQGEVVEGLAQHLDVMPTLLAAAGVERPAGLGGHDLLAGPPPADRPAVAHLDFRGRAGVAVFWDRWKWIEPATPRLDTAPRLYDLVADPGETRDLAAARPVVAGWLRTLLRAERLLGEGRAEEAELDAESREALEALGYL